MIIYINSTITKTKEMFSCVSKAIDCIYDITNGISNGDTIDANVMNFANESDWLTFSKGVTNSLSNPYITALTNDELIFNFRNYDFRVTHQGNRIYVNASVRRAIIN